MGSFFVVQGASMDRVMFGGGFVIPSASLALFNTISIIVLIPIYDRGVVPLLHRCGTKLSHLQRIGTRSSSSINQSARQAQLSSRKGLMGCLATIARSATNTTTRCFECDA